MNLEQFKQEAIKHNMCKNYEVMWNRATSIKKVIDLAFTQQGIEFLCKSIEEKWGMKPIEISKQYGQYLNSNYKYENGYTSKIYCCYKGIILGDCSLYGIIESYAEIKVESWNICEIYVCGDSEVVINGKGKCSLYVFGDKSNIIVNNKNCKIFQK